MAQISLGKTGIVVEQNGFGALPIQRISLPEAVSLLQRAFDGGIRFYDTARAYSDSEQKLGAAFGATGLRKQLFLASKTQARTPDDFWRDLETSLKMLQTDYLDLYQFHLPPVCYLPDDGSGMYECMLQAQQQGMIRHIGLTNHALDVARDCIASGQYETLQFPLSYLSGPQELELVQRCKDAGMGYIAMKALAGGLITNSRAACAYLSQFDHVLPIWGIQRQRELDEFLSYIPQPPELTPELEAVIAQDRRELVGDFCRGCGYCMPCPQGIQINQCARMSLLLRRAPSKTYLEPDWQQEMAKIETCLHCGACAEKCPYHLDTPALLEKNYADYQKILRGEISVTP